MAIVRLRSADLKQALEAGALSLHYQPQVVIATGKLAGVEAFVRWPHPAYGMIGPSDIITLVDQAGMHVEFDRWVVGEICRQAKRWRKEGVAVPIVAANVWAQTLRRPDALKLMDALAETGVDPKTIELECPRGSTADPALTKALMAIRALGVRGICGRRAGEWQAEVRHAQDPIPDLPRPCRERRWDPRAGRGGEKDRRACRRRLRRDGRAGIGPRGARRRDRPGLPLRSRGRAR